MFAWIGGALCVLAAASVRGQWHGSWRQRRVAREIGAAGVAAVVALALFGDARTVAALAAGISLALVGGFVPVRGEWLSSASMQASLVTLAFGTWLLPQGGGASVPVAMAAGGAMAAAALCAAYRRPVIPLARVAARCGESWHLLNAGACAAIAYTLGARSGAFAVASVCAMALLIGAHLSLALAGRAAASFASLVCGASACLLTMLALGESATHGGVAAALVVAGVALAAGCGASCVRGVAARGVAQSRRER